jgi:hypothetical protein
MKELGAIADTIEETAPLVYFENVSGMFCFGLPSYLALASPNVSVMIFGFPVLPTCAL